MGSNNLELAFYGQLTDGVAEADVKQNVAAMFKASVDQVERMFTGNRVVIRNKLDYETAQKYVGAMAKRGAVCKIEMMGQPGQEFHPDASGVSLDAPPTERHEAEASPPASDRNHADAPMGQDTEVRHDSQDQTGIAGDKVDDILSKSVLDLEPVGVRLSDESEPVPEVELKELGGIEILPPGSDLQDEKEEVPVSVPDISHITLQKPDQ